MKLKIDQKTLIEGIANGGMAALSDEAQSDTSNMAMLIKSVKIVANKNSVVVSSNVSMVGSEYTITKSGDDKTLDIEEEGSILVPAKELNTWVKAQGDNSIISLSLERLATPEKIYVDDEAKDNDENENSSNTNIDKVGVVSLVAKDNNHNGSKWEVDCYDVEQRKMADFSQKQIKLFSVNSSVIIDAINNVSFAVADKDAKRVYDSVLFEYDTKSLFVGGCDKMQVAIYRIDQTSVSELKNDFPIRLLLHKLICETFSKFFKSDVVLTFSISDDESPRLFISNDKLKLRFMILDKKSTDQYAKTQLLFQNSYDVLCEINRSSLLKSLLNASVVNKDAALLTFSQKDKLLTVKAVDNHRKYKPNVSKSKAENVTKDYSGVYNVGNMIDMLKLNKSETVFIAIPSDTTKSNPRIKMTCSNNDIKSVISFFVAIETKLYS